MYLFPTSVIRKIAEESRSGMADAPTVPYEPPRDHLRAVRRLLHREPAASAPPATRRPALTLLPGAAGSAGELCEAEVRDRGTKVAGAARAC